MDGQGQNHESGEDNRNRRAAEPAVASERSARRGFLAGVLALAAGGLAVLAPLWSAASFLLDPVRRRRAAPGMVMVTKLAALPGDGVPRKFRVISDRVDAWTKHARTPVGAVYLRRSGDSVAALSVVCPHAGCFVNVSADRSHFVCPCHGSRFGLDGAVADPSSPSPRDMDALEVDLRNGEVWVRYRSFRSGTSEKTPVA